MEPDDQETHRRVVQLAGKKYRSKVASCVSGVLRYGVEPHREYCQGGDGKDEKARHGIELQSGELEDREPKQNPRAQRMKSDPCTRRTCIVRRVLTEFIEGTVLVASRWTCFASLWFCGDKNTFANLIGSYIG